MIKAPPFYPMVSHIGDTACAQESRHKHVVTLKELIGQRRESALSNGYDFNFNVKSLRVASHLIFEEAFTGST